MKRHNNSKLDYHKRSFIASVDFNIAKKKRRRSEIVSSCALSYLGANDGNLTLFSSAVNSQDKVMLVLASGHSSLIPPGLAEETKIDETQ